jgi:rhamnose transport system ATP-binding protein
VGLSGKAGKAPTVAMLTLKSVSKSFPGVKALTDVSMTLHPGQTTALIGENGAGKSTIVKILTGVYSPDEGHIEIDGRRVDFRAPSDAWAAGITAIHQETAMFDDLTVAENIYLGHSPLRHGLIDWPAIRQRTQALLKSIEADLDPDMLLKQLGVAQKHLVSIARALSHDSRIVIMDEPTASLSAQEIEELFKIVDRLKAEGRAILFISHKFDEIFHLSDRWVCLRDGEKVGEGMTKDVTEAELVRLMVGRSVDQVFPKTAHESGPVRLSVEGLSHPTEFADISFSVRAGRILGLYGLVGAGRSEIMQCLFGLTPRSGGVVKVDGKPVLFHNPGEAIAAGLAYVPEDRQVQGTVLPFGVRENTTLASLAAHVRHGLMSRRSELDVTRKLGRALQVRASSWEQTLRDLSGGNQQKVVIAKWLASTPKVLILDEPTKGIDIGSKAAIHQLMDGFAGEGLAIILVSSELPEIMGMADDILVLHEGRIVASHVRGSVTAEEIVSAATGARRRAA